MPRGSSAAAMAKAVGDDLMCDEQDESDGNQHRLSDWLRGQKQRVRAATRWDFKASVRSSHFSTPLSLIKNAFNIGSATSAAISFHFAR